MGEIHASAHDVFKLCARLFQSFLDDKESMTGLCNCVGGIRAYRSCAGAWTVLSKRTAREKPMTGSKGDDPEMFLRIASAPKGARWARSIDS
jgi:hypothetical protein